jgi:hypothetical protein
MKNNSSNNKQKQVLVLTQKVLLKLGQIKKKQQKILADFRNKIDKQKIINLSK